MIFIYRRRQYPMKPIKSKYFNCVIDTYGASFRIFGYGLRFIDRNKFTSPFSIRSGIRKEFRLGKWGIGILTPFK